MRVLLDTHVWLWARDDARQLGPQTKTLLAAPSAEIYLSAVSAWEVSIKWRLGKLKLNRRPLELVEDSLKRNALLPLTVNFAHACAVGDLADHHSDPFDRLLVAQAQVENLELLTADQILRAYPVRTLWALD